MSTMAGVGRPVVSGTNTEVVLEGRGGLLERRLQGVEERRRPGVVGSDLLERETQRRDPVGAEVQRATPQRMGDAPQRLSIPAGGGSPELLTRDRGPLHEVADRPRGDLPGAWPEGLEL